MLTFLAQQAHGGVVTYDVLPGPSSFVLDGPVSFKGDVYFAAANTTTFGTWLWKVVPGTAAASLVNGNFHSPFELTKSGNLLFFRAKNKTNFTIGLWKTDGASGIASEIVFAGSTPRGFTSMADGRVFFVASGNGFGEELWVTDGTAAGTRMVKDITPGPGSTIFSSVPGEYPNLTAVGSTLYFVAGATPELWKSDGTNAGTTKVLSSAGGLPLRVNFSGTGISLFPVSYMTAYKGDLFFSGSDGVVFTLWRSNPTTGITTVVAQANNSPASPGEFAISTNNTLYFVEHGGTASAFLWRSDGTAAGTFPITSFPAAEPTDVNNELYFTGDGSKGWELYKTNGNPGQAVLVVDINQLPGAPSKINKGSNTSFLTYVNSTGALYFAADDGIKGFELWKVDIANTTATMTDINPGPAGSAPYTSPPGKFAVAGGTVFFIANDPANGGEVRSITPEPVSDSSANCDLCSGIGEPINTFTGELYEPLPADINLGGPMALVFQRYYAAFLRRSLIVGDLGSNWRHNFDARLTISGNTAKYISWKGRVTDFVKNLISGVWEQQNNLDTTYKLTKPAGQNAALFDPQDNLVYSFDYTSGNTVIGKLASVADGKGNVHTVTYNLVSGQIQTVSDGLGRTLAFSYNADVIPKVVIVSDGTRAVNYGYTDPIDTEYLTLYTDVRGGVTTYAYKDTSATAEHALMTQWTLPRGNIPFSQTFDAQGRVLIQTDASGNATSLGYGVPSAGFTTLTDPMGVSRIHSAETSGAFNGMQDQAGKSFSLTTDVAGRRNSLTDRLGDTTSMAYHAASGKLSNVSNADGTSSNYTYSARTTSGLTLHDMSGVTHADGTAETMVYDVAGNLTSRTDQLGNTSTFSYNGLGQVLTATNKLLGVTTNIYNVDGTLASSMDPATNSTLFGYDLLKRPILTTYADGSTSSITYDAANHLLTATDENGNTTTMTYDANGNLVTSQDALLNTTSFAYDGNDRLISATDALGGITGRTYHPLGEVGKTTDANGNTTTMGYDTLGRLTSITDPLGNIWLRTYDAEAIITSRADPLGNTTNFVSDKMGRITQTSSPSGNISKVSYDAMGRVATTTDALNQVTTFSRDARGQITAISLPGGTISSTIVRNAAGEPTSITDPNGNAWNQSYDTGGRLISATDPLGQSKTTAYDNRNRPATITFPGALGTQTMGYDAAGNTTSVNYSDGAVFSFSYDARNNLTSANNGGTTPNNVSRAYDANGRISNSNSIAITRDAGGRITAMTLAAGKAVTYAYDANDNLTSVTDWAGGITTFSYDVAGRLTGISRPNGMNTTHTWDNDSRLTGISEGAVSSISLTRDVSGQITAAVRVVPTAASAATLTGQTNTYDAASQIVGDSYDALGRQMVAGVDSFSWDHASRLTAYTVGGANVANTYDALGRRISRTVGANTVDYIWNDAMGLPSISLEQRNAANFRYFIHTPGGDLLYSIDATANSRNFYHYDEMGNTIFITDDAGTVIGSYAYTPFGQLITSTVALDNPFTWQGRNGIMDEGNGLYYVRARYYDANTGRFISRDPKKSTAPRKVNPYQYALNNPLMFVDMSGADPDKGKTETAKDSTRTDKAEREARIKHMRKHMRGMPKPRKPEPLKDALKDANKFLDWVSNGLNPGAPGIEDVVIIMLKTALTIPKNSLDAEKIASETAKVNADTERVEARRKQAELKQQAERNAKVKEALQLIKDREELKKVEFQNALIEGQVREGVVLSP